MTQTSRIAADDALSPVRALNSLAPAQVDRIVAGLSGLAGTWGIERHESCDGYLSLLIAHADHDTTIIVDRDPCGLRIGRMSGDELVTGLHRYATTRDTVAAIKAIVAAPDVGSQRHAS